MENKIYRVAVTETRRKIVTVMATSSKQAQSRARDAYENTEIILTDSNHEGTEFYVLNDGEFAETKTEEIEGKD